MMEVYQDFNYIHNFIQHLHIRVNKKCRWNYW